MLRLIEGAPFPANTGSPHFPYSKTRRDHSPSYASAGAGEGGSGGAASRKPRPPRPEAPPSQSVSPPPPCPRPRPLARPIAWRPVGGARRPAARCKMATRERRGGLAAAVVAGVLLALGRAAVAAEGSAGPHRRFEYKYSFKGPHLVQADGTVPFWAHTGSKWRAGRRAAPGRGSGLRAERGGGAGPCGGGPRLAAAVRSPGPSPCAVLMCHCGRRGSALFYCPRSRFFCLFFPPLLL